jgi:hypothetical protein
MPVRKIPKTYRSISGRFPSAINKRCVGYESKLERDCYLRKEFDRTISNYEEQPIRLTGKNGGRNVSYTPDCLTNYKGDKPAQLEEVKYQEDLDEQAAELEPRFELAKIHAKENGIEFRVTTEAEIYSGSVDNLRLLYRFTKPPNNFVSKRKLIMESMEVTGEMSLKDLLMSLGKDRVTQAGFTRSIWHLLYIREIETNLDEPFGYHTILRIANGKNIIT